MSTNLKPMSFNNTLRNRLACLLWLASWALSFAARGEQAPAEGYRHRFENAEQWSQVFDDPKRDQWQKPDQVIAQLNLPSDAKIADIGAGTGYFAMRFARQVPSGIVYAIDVEPDMTAYLETRAKKEGLGNVRPVLAGADNPGIPEPVNLIFVCDTYHHIGRRSEYFRKLHPSLLPGGRIAIVDYRKDKPSPVGPPPAFRIDSGQVVQELGAAGFRLVREDGGLDYQYVLIFESGESPTPKIQSGKP